MFRSATLLCLVAQSSAQTQSPHEGETCHIDYFHKTYSSPEPDLALGPCAQYQDNSCCDADAIHANATAGETDDGQFLLSLYGAEFAHNLCGEPSAECTALLVEEACGYECDVNWGRFRHSPVECGETPGAHYNWQVSGMPIQVCASQHFNHFAHNCVLTFK